MEGGWLLCRLGRRASKAAGAREGLPPSNSPCRGGFSAVQRRGWPCGTCRLNSIAPYLCMPAREPAGGPAHT